MSTTSMAFDILARDRASKTFDKVGNSAGGLGSKMAMSAKAAAAGFGVATVAAGAFLLKVGAPYVASLNKIQVLTDSSDARMRGVAKTLEGNAALYAKMGMTTGDAAAGVVELTKAGMTLDASMKAVAATMVLAKAGEMTVADASTLVSNTLNTFGLKAQRAADVANYLANAANISSADVADLAEAFKYVSPLAAAAGVKVQTVSALLAELANKGINASVAGTGLRNMFLSLKSPSGAGGKAIKDLGVHVFTADGHARKFKAVLGDLATAVKGVDDKTRAADLKAIFGKQGITAAQVLLEGGVKGLNNYEKGVVKAGAAQRFADSSSKGLMGTLRMFKAEAVSSGQAAYRAFSPLVDGALRPIAVAFGDLTKNAGPALSRFVAQGPGKLKSALAGIGGSNMGQQLAKTGSALAAFGTAMLPTLKHLGTELMTTLGPGLKQIGAVISGQLLPAFRNILPVIAPVAKFLLNMFGGALIGVISGAIKVIKGLLTVISGVFNLIADLVHGRWGKIWGDLGQIMKGALGAVVGVLQVWWNMGILSLFKRGFVMLTKGIWIKGFEMLKGTTTSALHGIEGLMARGVAGIGRALLAGVKGYVNIWRTYLGFIRAVVVNGLKVLRSAFGGALAAIRTVVAHALGGVRSAFSSAMSGLKGLVSGAMRGVASAVSNGVGRVVLFYARMPGRILGAVGNLGSLLVNAGRSVITGLIAGITSQIGALTSKLKSITHLIPLHKGPLHKDRQLLTPAGVAIMEGLIHGIRSRETPLKKVLEKVTGYVASLGDKLSALQEVKQGFLDTFSGDSIFSTDMSEGGGIGAVMSFGAAQLAKAQQLAGDVSKVISMGLSGSLIDQLRSQGSSGADALHAIAGGSGANVSQLNAMDAATNAALQAAGMTAGNASRGGNIDSDISRTQRELQVATALEKALAKMDLKVYIQLEGEQIVKSVKIRNRRKGVATAGI